ncbi:MAG: hypothetical protein KAK00_00655 [Nanoarchaeota archaeon]|nr:hypothetical protein [Nanoarchaeota archaeon]
MITIFLIGAGVCMFLLSVRKYIAIIKYAPSGSLRIRWIFLFVLTVFFLLGYIAQIIIEYRDLIVNEKVLIGLVYLFGAIYVLLVVSLSLSTIKQFGEEDKIKERSEKLELFVRERTKELGKKSKELEKSKKELENKVLELEKFNTLSVGRELRMVELKKKIKELEEKLK